LSRKKLFLLILGDILSLLVITLIGFANHKELTTFPLERFLSTFLPLLASWFLISPWLGLFKTEAISDPRQLWRPVLAMLLAAPLASLLRAVVLNSVVIPLFVFVLGCSAALGLLVWRTVWWLVTRKG
jgi:Protein of unknown function (DUF3054)